MPNPPHSSDLQTARRILQGDERAFRDLFDRFFPRLYRFALVRLAGDHDLASEVVQETLCKGLDRLETYRGEAALYTWFCQICRHALIDQRRKAQRSERFVRPLEEEPDVRAVLDAFAAPVETQPEAQAWHSDIQRLVQATMDILPERYGDVLEWKYVDGLPVNEIAARLDLGPKAAESLLTRARTAFRDAIMAMVEIPDALRSRRQDWSL
ncbi:MAG TPA: sigma-70 family RNA polymerase sigma factor [Steroidobacter sp.]|uniref:RNA polymerase sigma factor n=1 Tax=Steroidobacter sp. TaxID=1978227 RepID=UPI002ED89F68